MISIVGGTYLEVCMLPQWKEYYGSAGRAASVIAALGGDAELFTYADDSVREVAGSRSALEGFKFHPFTLEAVPRFSYHHCLEVPAISVPYFAEGPIQVAEKHVIRYGLIEGDAIVNAEYAVYDPQSPHQPIPFGANGSNAEHLAVVLNEYEARVFAGKTNVSAKACAESLIQSQQADVVIVKMGPKGALVVDETGPHAIPAFKTDSVWKIGSGDTFVAVFGYYWMEKGFAPKDAALMASKATAFYCQNRGFPTERQIQDFTQSEVVVSDRFMAGYKPKVYLAGPFFSLAQLWLIDEARKNLSSMGLNVFSPYHDVGRGSAEDVVDKDLSAIQECDLMLAIGDGLDSGTMYEIGYAKALNKSVVLYSENESVESKKMMQGSGCHLCSDYVTSIYKTVWVAAGL